MPKRKEAAPLTKSTNHFPVVGIGASAGGLDAFKKLLKAIPKNSGMAYVLVQHLHPGHESMLADILQKVTEIPVLEITDDIKVQPNHIYIIPSNKMMIANDGVLLLSPRSSDKSERNLPIDLFFASLAEVHQSHSIGVILSGTASDGTKGLKAIKDHGGITFAQDTESAAYDSMPESAIHAGVVDFILPPEKIPQKLLEVTKITGGNESDDETLPPKDEDVFKQMLALLRLRKGTDFTYYKQTTIRRRILRRMALNKIGELTAYLKLLRENKEEQDTLYQDLLIPVTSFFRDTKTFDNLCDTVFEQIKKKKNETDPIRIWVAGCSTGQEVYSMAICLKEFLGDKHDKVQIFGTDISEPAIAKARSGIYTKSELDGLTPRRQKEFFTKINDSFQLNRELRDMCVFAVHNFLKDPPFGKLDLISCRNVLIYMEPYLQKKALTTFHYALNNNGFLLLGKSETISSVPELFVSAHKGDKIFGRKDVPAKYMHTSSHYSEQHLQNTDEATKSKSTRTDFQKTADDLLLSKYTPAGVVVNEAMDIVHFRGKTGNYLEQLPGKPSHNLLKMAKEGLAFELRNILHKAKKEKRTVTKENIPLKENGILRNINIEALLLPGTIEPHYLVLFHELAAAHSKSLITDSKLSAKTKIDNKDLRIAQLEKELEQAREDMRSITEDQEAVNEELQSANEELLSGSEELQSLNEELETGKEELQSTNEELTVVNQEMFGLNEQVTDARNYAETIIATLREPLLVLDKNLKVKTANKSFYKVFQVNEKETEGKLIYQLGNEQWNIPELRTLLENLLPHNQSFTDFEVSFSFPHIGQRTMLLNASEIINENGTDKLILISFGDITERRIVEKKILDNEKRFRNLLLQSPFAVALFKGRDMVIDLVNDAIKEMWGREKNVEGKSLFTAIPELNNQVFKKLLQDVFETGEPYIGIEMAAKILRLGVLTDTWYNFAYQPYHEADDSTSGVVCIAYEVTEQIAARNKMEESEARYHNLIYSSPSGIGILKGEHMIITIANDAIIEILGKGKDVFGKPYFELLPELAAQGYKEVFDEVYKTGKPYVAIETPVNILLNGELTLKYYNFILQPQHDVTGEITGVGIIATEVTSQAEYNIQLRESEERFRSLADNVPMHIFIIEPNKEATISYWNKNWLNYTGQTMEEALGRAWDGIMHPDDVQPIMDVYMPAFEKHQPYFLPAIRVRRYDGEYRWHSVQANPRYLPTGEFIGYIGVGFDIHESKQAQDALKASEAHFRLMADLMPAKISNADSEGNVIYFNQHWLDFTGMDFEELKAFGYHKIMHPDELEEFQNRLKKAAETGTDLEMEMRFKNKAGEYKWHLNLASPVKDENGNIKMWVGATTEIQKIKEEEERKGNFIKMVSHELKTPVTSIKGYVQFLLSMLKDKPGTEVAGLPLLSSLTRIDTQVLRLTRLITEMLDLTRLETGKLELKKELFGLEELVNETVKDITYTNTKHIINIDTDFTGIVYGDKDRLGQVLINLINNAIKYSTDNNQIDINIYQPENNLIAVSVKDYGIGINKADQLKIFERFFRAGGKSEQTYAGFGIGLYIANEIMERHQGFLSVESEKGKGSAFTFTLPLATANEI